MEAVAGYKRILIENWLVERLNDLTAALHSSLLIEGDFAKGSPALFSDFGSDQFDAVALIAHNRVLLNPGFTALDSAWAASLSAMFPSKAEIGKELVIYGKTEYDPRAGTWFTLLRAFPTFNRGYFVAAGRVRIAHSLDKLLSDSIGLGQTGQSYLIDSQGIMLTGSRFHHHPAAGTHKMSSPAIESALAGHPGVGIYDGWLGNRSLGAWSPIAGTGWALIAEMDENEALTPIRQLRNEWLVIALFTLILSGLAASLLSGWLGKPILELAMVTKSVTEGDLKVRSKFYRKDELGELAGSFDKMIEALDASNRALKKSYIDLLEKERLLVQAEKLAAIGELVASVVHELRNPLSAVKMNLNILSRGLMAGSVEAEQFMIAIEQAGRMERMLGTILEFSKPVHISVSQFSINKLLNRTIETYFQLASDKNIHIKLNQQVGEITIFGDSELLTQAFSNIIRNSLDALETMTAGTIQIDVGVNDDAGEKVRIAISDNGRGMEQSTKERIFEPFFTTRLDGTGLGLPNVKKVIELHRGTIEIMSEPGRGTRVEILLPTGDKFA